MYWRRRAVALAVALTVTVLLSWGVTALFGSPSMPKVAGQLPAPAPGAPAAASAVPPECPDAATHLVADVGRPVFKVGERISFSVVVTNTGPRPCVRDLNRLQRETDVLGPGGLHVWSSNDCTIESTDEKPLLQPGQSVRDDLIWPGQTSTPDCGTTHNQIPPGDYVAVAKLAKIASGPVAFKVVP